jgi:hypothetical protein
MALQKTRVGRGVALSLAYLGITLVMTYPLVFHITSFVIADEEDGAMSVWNLWWMKFALANLHHNPLDCKYLFFPYGVNLIYHSIPKLLCLLSVPFQYLLGLTATYNLVVIFTFVGSGMAAYWLIYYLLKQRLPAFLGGAIFAFCPYRWGQMAHINLLPTMLIPVYVLLLFKGRDALAEGVRRAWLYFVLAGLSLAAIAYDTEYYAVFLMLFSVVFAAFHFPYRHVHARVRNWLMMVLGIAAGLALAAVLYAPLLIMARQELATNGNYVNISVFSSAPYGADLLSFLVPQSTSEYLKPLVRTFSSAESTYIGWTVLALSCIGIASFWRRRETWMWAVTAIIFASCALGPYLVIRGNKITMLTPYYLLSKVPLLNAVRTPSRFVVITMLALSVLAAYGFSAICGYIRRKKWPGLIVLFLAIYVFLLLGIEYKAPAKMTSTAVPAVYDEIASSGTGGAVISLPLGWETGMNSAGRERTFVELYQPAHGRPLVGGMVARAPLEKVYRGIYTPVLDFLADPSQDLSDRDRNEVAINHVMDKYQVAYIVAHKIYPEMYYEGDFIRGKQLMTDEDLARVDEYVTGYLGMEKFFENEEVIAYRRR